MALASYRLWALAGILFNGALALAALAFLVFEDFYSAANSAVHRRDVMVTVFLLLFLLASLLPVQGANLCWRVFRMDPWHSNAGRVRWLAVLQIVAVLVLFAGMTITLVLARDFDIDRTAWLVLGVGWLVAAAQVAVPLVLMRLPSPIGQEVSVADRFG